MPPPPKPRGGLAALAGEEEETNQGQAFVSTCILHSGKESSANPVAAAR
jgi:hypothetical protein